MIPFDRVPPRSHRFDITSSRCSWQILTALALAWGAFAGHPLLGAPPLVVESDPLAPGEQQRHFHLPPGFEIQLVISEPDIGQPMNLNFDAAGRLWITHSVEYPYPVQEEGVEPRDDRFSGLGKPPARDRVTLLSSIGGDGRPGSILHFADNMNIPIGIVGWAREGNPSGRGDESSTTAALRTTAVAYSIPHLYRLSDENGDGQADRRAVLYGPFGNLDTHGMVNSLTRYFDGWIYANHGFRNTSTVRGSDGHAVTMNSGNTFRFREDGSRVEQVTWGQVNPFGLTFDRWGNFYNADCHSLPLTCLIPGAYYPSFGKPHDGLGFGPVMIDHGHGSTGICGTAWYEAEQFPSDYRDCIYLCNPVNGQVHRDRIEYRGSSPWALTQPDFITCDDGWFRPVDVKLGPDGALYVADFYNCIIGHYEVPLDHPRRDRTHGRVWRIVYVGDQTREPPSPPPDLTTLPSDQLLQRIGSSNITERLLATNLMIDRGPDLTTIGALQEMATGPDGPEVARVQAVWILSRWGILTADDAARLAEDPSPLVRTHLARLLGSASRPLSPALRAVVRRLLDDPNPHVLRAAVQTAGVHPSGEFVAPLLRHLQRTQHSLPGKGDTHLLHAARIALRNHMEQSREEMNGDEGSPPQATPIAAALQDCLEKAPALMGTIALGTHNSQGAGFALEALKASRDEEPLTLALLQHVARYGSPAQHQTLVNRCRAIDPQDVLRQVQFLMSVRQGLQQGGMDFEVLHHWGADLARQLLDSQEPLSIDWIHFPLPGHPHQDSAFEVERRPLAGGSDSARFYSSLPKGERRTGILRSDPFLLPETLSFHVAGHNGIPKQPLARTSMVRLRDAATGRVLAECFAPRNDVAQPVHWDLSQYAGRRGVVEVVDGDDRAAYAWIAVGNFSIQQLNPRADHPIRQGADLIAALNLTELVPRLEQLMRSPDAPLSARLAAASAIIALSPDSIRDTLLAAAQASPAVSLQERILSAWVSADSTHARGMLVEVMQRADAAEQHRLALRLTTDLSGGEALLDLIQKGHASPLLLTRGDIAQKLRSVPLADIAQRIDALTQSLPPASEQTAALIRDRKQALAAIAPDVELGAQLFKQHCAACHEFLGEGNKVGPQLDGVGSRGIDRLLEDILDPNRNVDAAFRTTTVALASGRILSGLKRRQEGAVWVFADSDGKEFTVRAGEIEQLQPSPLSLMPANLGEKLTEAELAHLLAYLQHPAR